MPVSRARRLVALFLIGLLSACESTSDLNSYIQSLTEPHVFTGALLVARGTTVLAEGGNGLADQERQVSNTSRTRFRIGSVTKQFTALSILLLEQRGQLSVRDPVCKHLDACPVAWQSVTLHHLLTHTSGIPDYTHLANFDSLIGTPASTADLVARFSSLPLEFPPGDHWSYSNSGYVLLGAVIEKLSGLSYLDFLQANIFLRMGMTSTGQADAPAPPDHATGYLSPGVQPVHLDMSEFAAAGALSSTVQDLYLLDLALLRALLVPLAALDEMMVPYVPCPLGGCALSSDVGYGYGWFLADLDSHRYAYHLGRIDGFRSSNGFYREQEVSVVVLSNLETIDTFGISARLGELAVAQTLGTAR